MAYDKEGSYVAAQFIIPSTDGKTYRKTIPGFKLNSVDTVVPEVGSIYMRFWKNAAEVATGRSQEFSAYEEITQE